MNKPLFLWAACCTTVLLVSPASSACTIFFAAKDGKVLAGNNEDWRKFDTHISFRPPEQNRYGFVFFGLDDLSYGPLGYPRGGMNDQGLFFDSAALKVGGQMLLGDKTGDSAILEPLFDDNGQVDGKRKPPAERMKDREAMMSRCATVEQALKLLAENGMRFKVLRRKGDYQVATNFVQSRVPPEKVTCQRYLKATSMLAKSQELSVDRFRSILKATHVGGTQYSNICDLVNGEVYVYQNHDFDKEVRLNLKKELSKGRREVKLADLFEKGQ
jgi:hypothetical protein